MKKWGRGGGEKDRETKYKILYLWRLFGDLQKTKLILFGNNRKYIIEKRGKIDPGVIFVAELLIHKGGEKYSENLW